MRIRNKPEETTLENQNALQYKDHSEFFEEYYLLRKTYTRNFADSYYDNTKLKGCYMVLIQLLEWSISQVEKVNSDFEKYDEELVTIMKYIKEKDFSKARGAMKKFFRAISKDHEESELIPKVDIKLEDEQERFWKSENNLAMREMKKAFYDVLVAN